MGGTLVVRLLPLVALASGLLMVSRVRYVHLANAYLRGRRPFWQVVMIVIVVVVFLWRPPPVLAVIVCGYAASGPAGALVRLLRGRRGSGLVSHTTETPVDAGAARKHA